MKQIRKFRVLTVAKVVGVIYAALGVLFIPFAFIVIAAGLTQGGAAGVGGVLGGILLAGEGGPVRGLRERLSGAVGAESRVLTVRDIARVAGETGLGQDGALLAAVGLGGHDQARARRLERGIAA